jgi:acyl carrier protein
MFDRILFRKKVADVAGRPEAELTDDTVLADVVPESFALVEMMIELQEEFRVRFLAHDELRGIRTLGDLVAVFERRAAGAAGE